MALIFVRGNAYRSFGRLFRNIIWTETTSVIPIKPKKFSPMYLDYIHCQSFFTSSQKNSDPKKLYELLVRGKHRGVPVWIGMTVRDLAESFKRPPAAVCEVLEKVTQSRWNKPSASIEDMDVIKETCKLFRVKPSIITNPQHLVKEEKIIDKDAYPRPPSPPEKMVKRPPVVTVMGHVDHGKTTLLDSLRNTQVVQSEFGGITQHIGAFTVKVGTETITFMDTPGHAAFTAMRERGAKATDLVVLVVAADDGVMEQTVESIRMAKEARVPMIVAVNKIDKPQANVQNTLHELINCEVVTEPVGGDVQAVPVSALTGKGLDDLSEAILAQAEIMDLRADPTGLVEGVVIESKKDKNRGNLSTALVQRGTLRKGDVLVAGTVLCKVRTMLNHEGIQLDLASPSTPVELVGWRDLPIPGDIILQVESEKRGNEVITYRKRMSMREKQKRESDVIKMRNAEHYDQYRQARLDRLSKGIFKSQRTRAVNVVEGDEHKLRIIIKGDVNGSVDAILGVLATYSSNDCELDIVSSGVGEPSENDIELAELFNAVIYCFNLKVSDKIAKSIEERNLKMKSYNVIYHLINDLKEEISAKMPSTFRDEILGEAKVLEIFTVNEKRKKYTVAGCECTSGVIHKSKPIRIKRDEKILFDGPIRSLRHLKDEVSSIKSGKQCGILPEDRELNIEVGDLIISYETIEEPGKCTWDPGF